MSNKPSEHQLDILHKLYNGWVLRAEAISGKNAYGILETYATEPYKLIKNSEKTQTITISTVIALRSKGLIEHKTENHYKYCILASKPTN